MTLMQTARGPIDTAQLGFTLMHEHIVLQSPGVRQTWPEAYDRAAAHRRAVEKLREAKRAGVDTIVDLTTVDNGQDMALLAEIARESDVNIVVATGLWRNVPRYFLDKSPDVAARFFVHDITEGIQGTGVKAALIKNATEEPVATGMAEYQLRAAARAHRETGVPISTHTDAGQRSGLAQQAIYADEGVDLGRVIIGHSGDTEDMEYLQRLLDAGSYLGMDRFGLDQFGHLKLLPDDRRVRVVAELCKQGYAERLVLSHDASAYPDGRSVEFQERTWPHWRWTRIPRDIVPALEAAGVSRKQIDAMTRENARAIFERRNPY
jgi:phosphotriesterase-related protein